MAKVWNCTLVNEHFKIRLLLEFEFATKWSKGRVSLLFVLEKDWVFFNIGAPVDLAQFIANPDYVDDEDHQGCNSCKTKTELYILMSTFNRVNDGCSTVADQMYRTSYGDKKDMYRLSEVFTLFVYSSLKIPLHMC